MSQPVCDIVIPIHNNREDTQNCLEWLARHTDLPYALILVDDASGPETADWLDQVAAQQTYGPTTLLRNPQNLRWTGSTNRGLEASRAPYVCCLNNDTLAGPGWLGRLRAHFDRHPGLALVQPQGNERRVRRLAQADIPSFARRLASAHDGELVRLSYISGYCLLLPRRVYEALGGFDPSYPQGHWADHDYQRRALRRGWFAGEAQDALVFHLETRTFSRYAPHWKQRSQEAERLFISRWGAKTGVAWLPPAEALNGRGGEQWRVVQDLADRGYDIHALLPFGHDPRRLRRTQGLLPHSNLRLAASPLPWPLEAVWRRGRLRYLGAKGRVQAVVEGPATALTQRLVKISRFSPGARAK